MLLLQALGPGDKPCMADVQQESTPGSGAWVVGGNGGCAHSSSGCWRWQGNWPAHLPRGAVVVFLGSCAGCVCMAASSNACAASCWELAACRHPARIYLHVVELLQQRKELEGNGHGVSLRCQSKGGRQVRPLCTCPIRDAKPQERGVGW